MVVAGRSLARRSKEVVDKITGLSGQHRGPEGIDEETTQYCQKGVATP